MLITYYERIQVKYLLIDVYSVHIILPFKIKINNFLVYFQWFYKTNI